MLFLFSWSRSAQIILDMDDGGNNDDYIVVIMMII